MTSNKMYSVIGLGLSIFIYISHFYIYNIYFQGISLFVYFLLIFFFWSYASDQEFNSTIEEFLVYIVFILMIGSAIAYITLLFTIGGGSIIIQKHDIFYFISYFVSATLLISSAILTFSVFFIGLEASSK